MTSPQGDNTSSTLHRDSASLSANTQSAEIQLLFRQIPLALVCETIAVIFLTTMLGRVSKPYWIIISILCLFIFSGVCRGVSAYYFKQYPNFFTEKSWLILIGLSVFLSSLGWVVASLLFLFHGTLLEQIFFFLVLLILSSVLIFFYSPLFFINLFFLLLALLPFSFLILLQNDTILLGIASFFYFVAMVYSAYYFNKLMSLAFHSKNRENPSLEARMNDLVKTLEFTKSTLDSTPDGILMVNNKGQVVYYNPKFLEMWGISSQLRNTKSDDDLINHVLSQLKNPEEFLKKIKELYQSPNEESLDELHFKDGKIFERYSKPYWLDNVITGRSWSFRDVTSRIELAYLANHDPLTGLPNRTLLDDRIEQGIIFAKRKQVSLTLFFLDIDNFKIINDTLGHDAGDFLLKEIAWRLKECIRDSDTVARFGGDEFVLLFMEGTPTGILNLAQNILSKIAQPIKLPTQEVIATTSIGISIYPKDGKDSTTLLKNADLAMYLAKKQGRNSFQFYNDALNHRSIKRLEMQTQMHNALIKEQFFLEYQPIISLKDNKIVGAEALVRWQHPKYGIILPPTFIPIAEETSFIIDLGSWIFLRSCIQNKEWQTQNGHFIRMGVNISSQQLKRDNFLKLVEDILAQSDLSPQYLELEFTENTIMENKERIKNTLLCFQKMGIQMAIDDFGTGFSSLNYLKKFSVKKLKIDGSIIRDCTNDPNSASIVEAIIGIGKSLKLDVVAEEVETIEQLKFLKNHECDEAQGNLFSPPVDAKTFATLMSKSFNP